MKKRVLSIVLALALLICMIPMGMLTASAASTRCGITANWQSTSSLPSSSGTYYYYLTSDITLSGRYTMPAGVTLYLDLNGHSVNCNVSNSAGIWMNGSSTFHIYGTGGGSIKRNNSATGSGICVENSSAYLYLHGGTISGFSASGGGGVAVNNGTFYMYGGTITGNTASRTGGGVYVSSNGVFDMSGGSITSNKTNISVSDNWIGGAGIYVSGGTVYLRGGSITNNISTRRGGGIMLNEGAKLYFYGGEITGNTTQNSYNGGAIYLRNTGAKTTFVADGGVIGKNTSSSTGGIVVMDSGYVTLTSGKFSTENVYSDAAKPSTTKTYTVTLNQNYGTGGTTSLSLAWSAALPSSITVPTRAGYTFEGYFDAYGVKYYNANGTRAVTSWDYFGNQTLNAWWTANKYTVTLDAQGGNGGTASVTATYDAAMPTATMPTKAGHVFNGYFDAPNGGNKYYNADGTSAKKWDKAAATALYAQWTENTATLTYDANGHGTAPAAVTMTYTEEAKAATAPTATGYTFNGWNTEANGTGDSYAAGDTVKAANTDPTATTLYAQWTENTATLTYNANGHGTAPSAVTMTYTEETKAATMEAVTGYTFNGWNTEANGKGNSYNAGETVKAANTDPAETTLYAQWTENTATLTYDANGHGTAPAAVTMTYSAATTAAGMEAVTGYTFNGWNTEADGKGDSYNAGETVKSANLDPKATTLYAQWSANVYAVTLNTDGTCEPLTDYIYGVGATLPIPSKEKSYFLGWYDNAAFTGAPITAIGTEETGDKEFFAKWTTVLYEYELTGAPTLGGDKDGTYSISTYYLDDAGEKVYIEKNRNTDVAISFESWYLRTMYQYRTIDGQLDIRFVSMLNDLIDDYAEAGFVFRIDELDWEETVTTNEVYTSFKASEIDQYIADYSRENDYFFLQNTLFSEDVVKEGYTVTVYAFVTDKDGNTYHGAPIAIDLADLI